MHIQQTNHKHAGSASSTDVILPQETNFKFFKMLNKLSLIWTESLD